MNLQWVDVDHARKIWTGSLPTRGMLDQIVIVSEENPIELGGSSQ